MSGQRKISVSMSISGTFTSDLFALKIQSNSQSPGNQVCLAKEKSSKGKLHPWKMELPFFGLKMNTGTHWEQNRRLKEGSKDTSKHLPLPEWLHLKAGPCCQSQPPPPIQNVSGPSCCRKLENSSFSLLQNSACRFVFRVAKQKWAKHSINSKTFFFVPNLKKN